MIRTFGLSHGGRFRPTNEDCFAVHDDLGLLIVADGLGGHNAGEIAARIAVDTIVDEVRAADRSAKAFALRRVAKASVERSTGERSAKASAERPDVDLLQSAIELANDRVRDAARLDPRCSGMGTTVVAARLVGNRLSAAYVGDSRLYLLSRGGLRQVTQDDSWLAAVLGGNPDVEPIALQCHPMRHAVTSAVGTMTPTSLHVREETVEPGDVVLLCTDGVHDVMDAWRLEQLLLEDDQPQAIADNVVRAALNRGSRDNCTVVVAVVCGTDRTDEPSYST